MSVCDRIIVLNFGEVIASGSPDAIRADPAVVSAYLGDEVHDYGPAGHPEAGGA
jgi:branched-chain amino acid transport system ATP-binding protein